MVDIQPGQPCSAALINLSFPFKLFHLLDEADRAGHSDVVSWMPHGRSFKVHEKNPFVTTVMPRYFNQSTYASFQRQLNLYGFHRIGSGPDKHGYYHTNFVRGLPILLQLIERMRVKGQGQRKPALVPPDFYALPYMPTRENTVERTAPTADVPQSFQQGTDIMATSQASSNLEFVNFSDDCNPDNNADPCCDPLLLLASINGPSPDLELENIDVGARWAHSGGAYPLSIEAYMKHI